MKFGTMMGTGLQLVLSDSGELWSSFPLPTRDKNLHMVPAMPLPPIISCFIKIQNGFTFLMPAYPGSPGKDSVKLVSVCL